MHRLTTYALTLALAAGLTGCLGSEYDLDDPTSLGSEQQELFRISVPRAVRPYFPPGSAPTGQINAPWSNPDLWTRASSSASFGYLYVTATVDDAEDGTDLDLEWYTNLEGHIASCDGRTYCMLPLSPTPGRCRTDHYLSLRVSDSDGWVRYFHAFGHVYDETCEGKQPGAPLCALDKPDLIAHPVGGCLPSVEVENIASWAEAGPTRMRFNRPGNELEVMIPPLQPGETALVDLPPGFDRSHLIDTLVNCRSDTDEVFSRLDYRCESARASYDGRRNNDDLTLWACE